VFGSTEPEEAWEYITQAEWDEAYELGINQFELPEVRDEQEEVNVESPFL